MATTPKYHLPIVVKLKIKNGQVVQGCDVYIARLQTQGGWSKYIHTASEWANPFKVGKDGTLPEVIAKYNTYIREKISRDPPRWLTYLKNIVCQGRPLVLGCWCKANKRGEYQPNILCHGDVIVQLCKEVITLLEQGKL
jgi:hypothetical protein